MVDKYFREGRGVLRAEEYLEQYNKLDIIIERKERQRNELLAVAESMGGGAFSADRVQTSRNLHRSTDALDKRIDIERQIKELEAKKDEILSTLGLLPYYENKVLYMLYIDAYILKEIPSKFGKSYAWAKIHKKKGLQRLQSILDERKDHD